MSGSGQLRTFSAAASNDRFVAATGHWKLKFGNSRGSSSVLYLIVRSHDGLELPAWMRCAMRRAWPGPGFIGNPHDGRPSDEPSEVAIKDHPSMSTPCPPSNSDNASNCNAPATEVTGRNVVRFPVERCRRPRPAGDQWVARAGAGLGAQTLGGRGARRRRGGVREAPEIRPASRDRSLWLPSGPQRAHASQHVIMELPYRFRDDGGNFLLAKA